jgi:hypothetical protein
LSSLARLDAAIAAALPVLEATLGRELTYVPPKTPVTEREVAGFYRAVDGGFFDLEDDLLCIPRRMRPSTGFCYPLISPESRTSSVVGIWREWLTHASLPAILHFDLGHPSHDIALDVDAFDALVFSADNQPLIAVEAKKTTGELEKTVREMTSLLQQPFRLRRSPPRLGNSEQKARSLLAPRPRFFLAVAPEVSVAFAAHYPPDPVEATALLEPLEVEQLHAATIRHPLDQLAR